MNNKKRIHIIDEIRGLCIIVMVVYHLCYTASVIYKIPWFISAFSFIQKIQPYLPISFATFILISGISFNLSSSNEKRGLKLLFISFGITLVTALFMPTQIIWFGILHFLAVANLICGLSKKYLDKVPFIVGMVLSAVLFLATYNVRLGYLGIKPFTIDIPAVFYSTDAGMMFGFYSSNFHSSDYTALLPYIFLFTFGIYLGRHINKLPKFLKEMHLRPLAFIGRHALIIYLVHQPIIFGIFYLLTDVFKII